MKVAVHAIALNEEQHVERWIDSTTDADLIVVGDTGSTDRTASLLQSRGAEVYPIHVNPWRFDTARNAAWALIPSDVDVVIKLDLDEVLAPGWRDALEKAWETRTMDVARFTYQFVWSWLPDGSPDVQFNADSIVTRDGWRWRSPCHETLSTVVDHESIYVPNLAIHHHPDMEKPRSSYLGLLAMGVQEEPGDDRLAHYYARELFYQGDWDAARAEFMRHLNLPSATWAAERAASWRYIAKMDADPERWLHRAIAEDPSRRETWAALAELYAENFRPEEARGAASRALSITHRPMDYISSAQAWDDERLLGLL